MLAFDSTRRRYIRPTAALSNIVNICLSFTRDEQRADDSKIGRSWTKKMLRTLLYLRV